MIALSVAKLKMFSPESEIFLWIKPKKKKKLFCGKFGSMPTFRSTRKGKKCFFLWWAYVCLTIRCYTTSHLHQVFSTSLGLSRFFRSYVVLQIFGVKEFNNTIIPFALVGYDWLFTISYPTSAHGIIVKYSTCNSNNSYFTSLTRTGGCTPTNRRFFHKQYFFDA